MLRCQVYTYQPCENPIIATLNNWMRNDHCIAKEVNCAQCSLSLNLWIIFECIQPRIFFFSQGETLKHTRIVFDNYLSFCYLFLIFLWSYYWVCEGTWVSSWVDVTKCIACMFIVYKELMLCKWIRLGREQSLFCLKIRRETRNEEFETTSACQRKMRSRESRT